jgi:hypothetical protein
MVAFSAFEPAENRLSYVKAKAVTVAVPVFVADHPGRPWSSCAAAIVTGAADWP